MVFYASAALFEQFLVLFDQIHLKVSAIGYL